MKILVIGATGTIGKEVVAALSGRHEVVAATRTTGVRIDIDEPASIRSALAGLADLDAVVSCTGNARFKPLLELADDDFAFSLGSKLMGQVNLVRAALGVLRDGGSVTVTTGILAAQPIPGSAAISMVNAGLEGFVRAAALEAPRAIRVNAVSPPWARETLIALGMDPAHGKPAAEIARAYLAAIEGGQTGATIPA